MRHNASFIMSRSFADCMGIKWPKEIARIVNGVPVTWAEIHTGKVEQQRKHLARIRAIEDPIVRPCYVWTFFNEQDFPYHGWYCYIVTRNLKSFGDVTEAHAVNFRGLHACLAKSIIRSLPVGTSRGLLPLEDQFIEWMPEFTNRYPRKKHKHDPRKAGVHFGWYDRERRVFSVKKPTA